MRAMKPKNEELVEFWEGLGLKQVQIIDGFCMHVKDEGFTCSLDLDLSNLARYAMPKVIAAIKDTLPKSQGVKAKTQRDQEAYRILYTRCLLNHMKHGGGLVDALFWAIREVIPDLSTKKEQPK